MTNPSIVLETRNVTRQFGGVTAVADVSLQVRAGERRLILGPNGAGKSVLFGLLGGQIAVSSGTVHLLGENVTKMKPYTRSRRGLARTFQLESLFPTLTVRENVSIAVQAAKGIAGLRGSALGDRRIRPRADELLERWRLLSRAEEQTRLLSYGERRRLEIMLALAGSPTVLLLDEPTAGLTDEEGSALLDTLEQLDPNVAVLMIEHDMAVANRFATHITVLALGKVIADGEPEEVRKDETVRRSYLGN